MNEVRLGRRKEGAGAGCAAAGVLFLLLLLLAAPSTGGAQAFPLYDRDTSITGDEATETWVLWPFILRRDSEEEARAAFHPIFVWSWNKQAREKNIDVLWPIYTYRQRPQRIAATNYSSHNLFPIYYDRWETRNGQQHYDRLLLPLLFHGWQGNRGRYFILFPIIWYAENARLAVPFFPPREQTFGAVFPLAGQFRNYWARDRIRFFLWPLFVHSEQGTGEDYNQIHSFVWPITGYYSGPKTSGFRLWPLGSYVRKEGEFRRGYWLWPLGHYRKGRISRANEAQEDVVMFVPFYARFRRPNVSLDLVFPFYGRLEVRRRISTGYMLALYNREINTRENTVEDRYLWFIGRSKRALPGADPEEVAPGAMLGGGVFPFYLRTESESRVRKSVLWPLHTYHERQESDHVYRRSYFVPVYSSQMREYEDGSRRGSRFLFPFFRYRTSIDGDERTNVFHLFFHNEVDEVDRLYSPIWTFYENVRNEATGEQSLRWFRSLYHFERTAEGDTRRRVNLLLFDHESTRTAEGERAGHTRLLFGLAGRHRLDGELKTELLGFKF